MGIFMTGDISQMPKWIYSSALIGGGMGIAVGLAFKYINSVSNSVTVESIILTMAKIILFVLIYEILDGTLFKDAQASIFHELSQTQMMLSYAGIFAITFALLGVFGGVIPLGARFVVSIIVGGYIATPNTGDDFWLLSASIACVIISIINGYITPNELLNVVLTLK